MPSSAGTRGAPPGAGRGWPTRSPTTRWPASWSSTTRPPSTCSTRAAWRRSGASTTSGTRSRASPSGWTGPGPCTRATTSAPRRSSQETQQHHGSGHAGQNGRGQQPEHRILEMQDGLRLHGASSCSCDARPCPVGGVSASPALRYARTARWSSRDLFSDRRPTGSRLRRPKTAMCDPEQLAVSDGSESDAASGEPDDEPEPYRPVLTDEEREVLRREWLTALRPSLLAGIERPDRGGSRRAEPSRPIRR